MLWCCSCLLPDCKRSPSTDATGEGSSVGREGRTGFHSGKLCAKSGRATFICSSAANCRLPSMLLNQCLDSFSNTIYLDFCMVRLLAPLVESCHLTIRIFPFVVEGASPGELHKLLQERLKSMTTVDTDVRLNNVIEYAEQSRASVAAKVALQSLQL